MQQLAQKFHQMEIDISEEKGKFRLFGLFLREDSKDKWDLIVSAKWIDEDKEVALQYLANQLKFTLDKDELLYISRIVIMEKDNPYLQTLKPAFRIEHSTAQLENVQVNGLTIKHAWIFACE